MKKRTAVTLIIFVSIISILGTWLIKDYMFFKYLDTPVKRVGAIMNVLDEYYLYDIDKEKIADGAAYGIASTIDDPYTTYYDKEAYQSYIDSGSGDYVGIGVTVVANDNDEIQVISCLEGGPGEEAGILPDDIITAIDGKEFKGSELNSAIAYIRMGKDSNAEEGSYVTITIKRNNTEKFDLNVQRRRNHNNAVSSNMIDDSIGYVRITKFNSKSDIVEKDTYDEFKENITALQNQGMKKLIIDLRDNPGGSESSVSKIADMLLPEGIIMYTEDKNGKRSTVKSDKEELDIPMVVLINNNSASASEMLSGALRDYNKAELVGKKTFGKGIMQTTIPFKFGGAMVVTIAKYFTPNGVCVQDNGLDPDYDVSLPEGTEKIPISKLTKEQDTQLAKAIELLK